MSSFFIRLMAFRKRPCWTFPPLGSLRSFFSSLYLFTAIWKPQLRCVASWKRTTNPVLLVHQLRNLLQILIQTFQLPKLRFQKTPEYHRLDLLPLAMGILVQNKQGTLSEEDFLLVMMFQGWMPRKSSVMSVEEKSSKALKKNQTRRIFCTSSDKSLLYPCCLDLREKRNGWTNRHHCTFHMWDPCYF